MACAITMSYSDPCHDERRVLRLLSIANELLRLNLSLREGSQCIVLLTRIFSTVTHEKFHAPSVIILKRRNMIYVILHHTSGSSGVLKVVNIMHSRLSTFEACRNPESLAVPGMQPCLAALS